MPSYEEMMKILGKPKPKKTNKSTFNLREQAQKDSMSLELWKKKEAYKDSVERANKEPKDKKQNKLNEQQVLDKIREYEDANKVIKNKLINIYGFDEELTPPDMELMDEEQLKKYKKDLTEDPKYGSKSQPYTAKQLVANHFLKNIEENNMRIAKLKNQFKSAPKDPLGIINE